MFKEASTLLLPYLVLSLAIHAGGIVLVDAHYGAPIDGKRLDSGQRLPLRVALRESPAIRADAPANVVPDEAASLRGALPAGTIALPGQYYFLPQELTRKPQAAAPVPLEYPENAPSVPRNRVVLRLLISEAGDVDKVMVDTADVPRELELIASKAFAQAKFQPGLRGEVAVKSQMLIEITFEADNTLPPPTALLPAR